MLIVAFGIRLQSPGPVFFRQKRVGKNGRLFILLKFRSMVQDAERKLDSLRDKNEMSGPVFKIKNDPRVTPFGRFLRRYSIDELPQLFNVLKGDMSLVGPRPPLPEEVSMYMRKQRKRLSMRPGLTCTWQVSGRNEIPDFEYWANLDLEYINTWSLWKDFKLLLRTIPAVLSGSGAS
jgi:lipopolysaccharide/colanic/teichoic acid biosynthesis glycosyltransferase